MALLAACSSAPPTPAEPATIGIVAAVTGSPSVVRTGREYIIGTRSRLFAGDILETDRFSRAHVDMIDGRRLEIGHDSRLVFHRYERGGARLTLTRGVIHAMPDPGDDGISLDVQTPVAVVHAGSAAFFGGFINAGNTLDVGLLRGSGIEVSNVHGTVEINSSGEGTSVIGGTAPQASRPWTPGKIERTLAKTGIEP